MCEKMFLIKCHQEMQIKMRQHCTPTRMAKIWNTDTTNAGEDVEPVKLSCIVGGHAKWYSHFGRQFISFYKTKHTLAI